MKCKTKALSHQICMAHLLNDLNYLTERYNHKGYPAYFKSPNGTFIFAVLMSVTDTIKKIIRIS